MGRKVSNMPVLIKYRFNVKPTILLILFFVKVFSIFLHLFHHFFLRIFIILLDCRQMFDTFFRYNDLIKTKELLSRRKRTAILSVPTKNSPEYFQVYISPAAGFLSLFRQPFFILFFLFFIDKVFLIC